MISHVIGSPFPASQVVYRDAGGAPVLLVVCKRTYRLAPGEAERAKAQEPPNEDDNHWDDDARRSLYSPRDITPPKARADVVLVGHAWSPGGRPVRSLVARVRVAGVDKSLEVLSDRMLSRDGGVVEGAPFTKLPLTYERAAGGPGTWNPVGVPGPEPGAKEVALPNVQAVGTGAPVWGVAIEPVGFGAIAPSWPARKLQLSGEAVAFQWRGFHQRPLPRGIDPAYFNVAPRDQQVPRLRGDETIELTHLHAAHSKLVTRLPGDMPRGFARVAAAGGRSPDAAAAAGGRSLDAPRGAEGERVLDFVCDTLWIDTTQGLCTLVWRATLPLSREHETPEVRIEESRVSGTLPSPFASRPSPPPPRPSPLPPRASHPSFAALPALPAPPPLPTPLPPRPSPPPPRPSPLPPRASHPSFSALPALPQPRPSPPPPRPSEAHGIDRDDPDHAPTRPVAVIRGAPNSALSPARLPSSPPGSASPPARLPSSPPGARAAAETGRPAATPLSASAPRPSPSGSRPPAGALEASVWMRVPPSPALPTIAEQEIVADEETSEHALPEMGSTQPVPAAAPRAPLPFVSASTTFGGNAGVAGNMGVGGSTGVAGDMGVGGGPLDRPSRPRRAPVFDLPGGDSTQPVRAVVLAEGMSTPALPFRLGGSTLSTPIDGTTSGITLRGPQARVDPTVDEGADELAGWGSLEVDEPPMIGPLAHLLLLPQTGNFEDSPAADTFTELPEDVGAVNAAAGAASAGTGAASVNAAAGAASAGTGAASVSTASTTTGTASAGVSSAASAGVSSAASAGVSSAAGVSAASASRAASAGVAGAVSAGVAGDRGAAAEGDGEALPPRDPASISLDSCAQTQARIDMEPGRREAVLRECKLSAAEHRAAHERWEQAIRAELSKGKTALLGSYDEAYVEALEGARSVGTSSPSGGRARGPVTPEEYATLVVAAERGCLDSALEEARIPKVAYLRVERVWLRRTLASPALSDRTRAAIERARED